MNIWGKKIIAVLLSTAVITTGLLGSSTTAEAKKKTSKAKNIVVVLDAGHDDAHNGCRYQGFNEEIANLYIAYYCKQELEKYSGVTVYMTRYNFECPFGLTEDNKADCLTNRVNYAKSVKADVLISLHNDLDPDGDVTQNGAKVIVPNPNYKPALCQKGADLGQSILTQLTGTGLNINDWKFCPNGTGIVTRDSASSKYPDGSAKDYYALINKSKCEGFPCIIVEHAFCSNYSDLKNHLSTPEQYMQLGTADATGIATYYGLKLK